MSGRTLTVGLLVRMVLYLEGNQLASVRTPSLQNLTKRPTSQDIKYLKQKSCDSHMIVKQHSYANSDVLRSMSTMSLSLTPLSIYIYIANKSGVVTQLVKHNASQTRWCMGHRIWVEGAESTMTGVCVYSSASHSPRACHVYISHTKHILLEDFLY